MPPRKRQAGAAPASKVKRAIAINARINKAYPYSTYGRAYYQRGTPENLARFGPTYKLADAAQRATRKASHYIGRGRYRGRGGFWGDVLGSVGSWINRKMIPRHWGIGTPEQWKVGGNLIGDTAAKIATMGQGAYVTNSLINPVMNSNIVPRLHSSTDESGELTFTHTEYVTDVAASQGTFTNQAWLVNPTNASLFPFLSQFAANYDEYEFMQLIFRFKSVTTDLSTSAAQIGTVIMACDYNAGHSPFTNKISMMQYDGAVSAKASDDIVFGVECDPKKNSGVDQLFIPPFGNTPVGEDPKTYNHGLMQLAVNQTVASGQIGELWVDYTVKLRKPKFSVAIGSNLPMLYIRQLFTPSAVTLNNLLNVDGLGDTANPPSSGNRVVRGATTYDKKGLQAVNTNLNDNRGLTLVNVYKDDFKFDASNPSQGPNNFAITTRINICGSSNINSDYCVSYGWDSDKGYTIICVVFPDSLSQGTFLISCGAICDNTAVYTGGIVHSSPNINILNAPNSFYYDGEGGGGNTTSMFRFQPVIQIVSSALNNNLVTTTTPQGTGTYLLMAVTCGTPMTFFGKTNFTLRLSSVNPGSIDN